MLSRSFWSRPPFATYTQRENFAPVSHRTIGTLDNTSLRLAHRCSDAIGSDASPFEGYSPGVVYPANSSAQCRKFNLKSFEPLSMPVPGGSNNNHLAVLEAIFIALYYPGQNIETTACTWRRRRISRACMFGKVFQFRFCLLYMS